MTDLSKFKPNLFSVIVRRYIEKVTKTKNADEWCYDYIDLFQKAKEALFEIDFEEVFKYAKKVEYRFDHRYSFKYLSEEAIKGLYLSHEVKCDCDLCKYVEKNYPEWKTEYIPTIYNYMFYDDREITDISEE